MTFIADRVVPLLSRVDAVVFDIDGVLVDVRSSYPAVIAEATRYYLTKVAGIESPGSDPITHAEISLFKRAGGFNDDWAIAKATVRLYLMKHDNTGLRDVNALKAASPTLEELTSEIAAGGGGFDLARRLTPCEVDEPLVQTLCEELYGGERWCELMFGHRPTHITGFAGFFESERSLIRPESLPRRIDKYGVYTSRVLREANPALQRCGLDPAHLTMLTASSEYRKPDPRGLDLIARELGATLLLFVGDNIDDWTTVDRYRRELGKEDAPQFLFAGVRGGALGDEAERIFRDAGADLVASDVNEVLELLR